jgi:hypothetical protein
MNAFAIDAVREARIESLKQMMVRAGERHDFKAAGEYQQRMLAEIRQRSPQQIARMERERGLCGTV